jgi:hypothetical protein
VTGILPPNSTKHQTSVDGGSTFLRKPTNFGKMAEVVKAGPNKNPPKKQGAIGISKDFTQKQGLRKN